MGGTIASYNPNNSHDDQDPTSCSRSQAATRPLPLLQVAEAVQKCAREAEIHWNYLDLQKRSIAQEARIHHQWVGKVFPRADHPADCFSDAPLSSAMESPEPSRG